VVVPTYNEKESVKALLDELGRARSTDTVVMFVDDSSPDGTGELILEVARREQWVHLMVRPKKSGIGSAYQDGFAEAFARFGPSVLVEMDADLQHPPTTIASLVEAVDGGADVAVGSRYVEGGLILGVSRWRKLVSRGANAYARTLLRIPVRDATSGFRAYTRAAAEEVSVASLPAKGFEFQVATFRLLRSTAKMVEVPYTFAARTAGRSKLGLSDMARFIFAVLWYALFAPRTKGKVKVPRR
jgi:dolichol-phosphate mannosyltransferase